MKHKIEGESLTIYLEGEINSYTSEDVEREIDKIVTENSFSSLILDLKDLSYISSAGLRIMVKLKQKYDDTSLVNVPSGVYDIFEMVGFDNMFKIVRL